MKYINFHCLFTCFISGIKSGHFSGAHNIPFQSIMDLSTKTIMDTSRLIKLFKENNVDLNQPLFASCGTGKRDLNYLQMFKLRILQLVFLRILTVVNIIS